MTASLVLALAMILPAQAADRPNGPPADKFTPDPAWKALDKTNSLWFDPRDRRLILRARVCLREGYLEHLLCSAQTKEHESILATKATPQAIHAGLILTKAEKGHPVRYRPRFEPPTGSKIDIRLEWVQDGKTKTIDARDWVLDEKKKKTLAEGWVFAGSDQFPDPDDATKTIYAADGGDLFTVANFTSAILDVPFASSGSDAERSYVANTEKIPPNNTYVTIFLRPVKPAATKP
ncbi:MAG: hypothetical protein JWN86_2101 [Planctomycetota bacterium]|nr:hypothetical protein [Planctomycetota bacterium]